MENKTQKPTVEKKVVAAAKTTNAMCEEIKKKIFNNKKAFLPEVSEVGGIGKDGIMKIIELLDGMGTATYITACAMRDLYNKMK